MINSRIIQMTQLNGWASSVLTGSDQCAQSVRTPRLLRKWSVLATIHDCVPPQQNPSATRDDYPPAGNRIGFDVNWVVARLEFGMTPSNSPAMRGVRRQWRGMQLERGYGPIIADATDFGRLARQCRPSLHQLVLA